MFSKQPSTVSNYTKTKALTDEAKDIVTLAQRDGSCACIKTRQCTDGQQSINSTHRRLQTLLPWQPAAG